MALSQIQCLDDNHVNPRTHESKPEFLYCEEQRLALEVLLRDGREAFTKHLHERGLRGFLSDPEVDALTEALEPYDPGSEPLPGSDEPPLSLQYWPELSDTSAPELDLGWPDSSGYRGVTRTTVHTQPPLEGQAHIKEVVRKMIAQAQKVIAVAMDVFTDVDIFRDLLDAGFKRRVSIYILLDHTALPHFLSMCERANMHTGHLKHLRVCYSKGTEFFTRSCTKVKGKLGHRFMFIDGDKAMSGSYSFTWMSSRLDRNLITVVTGQAVDAFDHLFRFLFMNSSSVDLRQVVTEPEPEPEHLPQPAVIAAPSAAIARKLYNPKYALVTAGNPSATTSASQNSPKEPQNHVNSKNPNDPDSKKRKGRKVNKEDVQQAPPLHPGLVNLEKACLISYLPTWPEPDPPSDVIGFINIRDSTKPTQVHLQRSEMFETSQAIRFSSPFSKPQEILPEVAKPRQFNAKNEELKKLQPTQNAKKAEVSVLDHIQSPKLNATEKPPSLLGSNPKKEASVNKQCAAVHRTHTQQSVPTDSNSNSVQHTTTNPTLPQTDAYTTAAKNVSTSVSPSCASSSLTLTPPTPKPRTIQLVIKDNGISYSQKLPEISVVKRHETLANMAPVTVCSEPVVNVLQTPQEKYPNTVPQPQPDGGCRRGAQKDIENTENPVAAQHNQNETSQEINHEEKIGLHVDRAEMQSVTGTKPQTQSWLSITDAAKANSVNTQEIIRKELDPKKLTSTDCKINQKTETDCAATVKRDSTAPEKNLTDCMLTKVPNDTSDNVMQLKTYHAKADEPQRISCCEVSPGDIDASESVGSSKASTHTSVSATTDSQTAQHKEINPKVTKHNTHFSIASQESPQAPKAEGSSHTERNLLQHLYDTHLPDFRSPTTGPESRPLTVLARIPTPCTHAPVSRMQTPELRSSTPDHRTPTPDISDGYISPREDSTLSTTSEEYYECSDSPFNDPAFRNHGMTVDSSTHSNTPNDATTSDTATSPGSNVDNTSSGEIQSLSVQRLSTSSVHEKVNMEEEREGTNQKDGRDQDKKAAERRGSYNTKKRADHLKQGKESAEMVEKHKDAQVSNRKNVLKQTAAERPSDGGGTLGELATKTRDAKRLSAGDLKPENREEERLNKEKTADKVALRSSSVERRDRAQSASNTERRKSGSHSPSKSPTVPRTTLATQLFGSRLWGKLNHTESKAPNNSFQILDNTSSPRRPLSRPPSSLAAGAVSSATEQKQPNVSHTHQGLLPEQAAAAQSKARFEKSQNQIPGSKPEASLLHSNLQSQNQTSVQEMHRQDDGRAPFSVTFSRLYSLKELKEKMSKLPAQNKRGSSSSTAQGRKSTS
ncbi:uncharacterized protein LOC115046985 [Echeneis naucrates]|uniref:Uncharacterized LOC115046985 n=1 Tax=Echeneis naucrates TaxID=173247 RepID=A0A665V9F5_ECHNA|nr:uncharacterized protein LOC115046985 [Echeneis naucrates]